jgi:hypothetical protein
MDEIEDEVLLRSKPVKVLRTKLSDVYLKRV